MAIKINGNIVIDDSQNSTLTGTQSVAGNITGGNVRTAGTVSATGNVIGGNITTASQVSATGNVTGGNVTTAGQVSATGNVTGGNIRTAGVVSATGNVTTAGTVIADTMGIALGGFARNAPVQIRVGTDQNVGINSTGTNARISAFNDAGTASVPLVVNGSDLRFTTDAVERMRILVGNVLIGYTSSNGNFPLQVNGQIFATNATISTSDRRYKENIEPIGNSLTLINSLTPVAFDWKEHSVHKFSQNRTVGFVAQDVANVLSGTDFADSVVQSNQVTMPDGTQEQFYGLTEVSLIPLMVRAIQELKAELDAVKQQLN